MERGKIIPFRHPGRERRRVAVFLAVLAVIALVLAFFAVDSGRNWDRVRRFFAYGSKTLQISMDSAPGAVEELSGNLVVADLDGVTLYDGNGKEAFVASANLSSPVLQTTKSLILAYDAGGKELMLLDKSGAQLLTDSPPGVIFDADLAPDGSMCYVSSAPRSKAQLQVYDREHLPCFTVYASTRYLTGCAVAKGADYVCAVALGVSEGTFASRALVYNTGREEPVAEVLLGNQLIFDINFWGDDTICALGEEELIIFNLKGQILGRYATEGMVNYSLEGDGFAALVFQEGAGHVLVTVDAKGRELGRAELGASSQVDVRGKYVAYLTSDGLTVSGKKLEPWSGVGETGSTLCICADGAAYLVGNQSATRYLP